MLCSLSNSRSDLNKYLVRWFAGYPVSRTSVRHHINAVFWIQFSQSEIAWWEKIKIIIGGINIRVLWLMSILQYFLLNVRAAYITFRLVQFLSNSLWAKTNSFKMYFLINMFIFEAVVACARIEWLLNKVGSTIFLITDKMIRTFKILYWLESLCEFPGKWQPLLNWDFRKEVNISKCSKFHGEHILKAEEKIKMT